MKRLYLTTIALAIVTLLSAQQLFRTEFVPYSLRVDAVAMNHSDSTRQSTFAPTSIEQVGEAMILTQLFELPYEWSAGRTYLHLENLRLSHAVIINGEVVGSSDDPFTPAEYNISSKLHQGVNEISVMVEEPTLALLQEGVYESQRPARALLESCYIYSERRRDIHDYVVRIHPDSTGLFAWLDIAAVVENGYNFEEPFEIGFDIYDPEGKLLDYSSRPITIAGNTKDTVYFRTHIYGADRFKWSPNSPHLYHVTLLTKSDGVIRNYLPMKIAYEDREYLESGEFLNFGERVKLIGTGYNATGSRAESRKEMLELKKSGYNTIRPDYPQPIWYYDLAAELGIYVIEQTNINAQTTTKERVIAGTPSNDPALKDEYINRAKSSYFRVKNNTSVIAFSMGGASGNGYNMYKLYEWFKAQGDPRPIIYWGAEGEWNSDKLILE